MLTSLILVSLTATTLLLLAAAAEEALGLARSASTRGAEVRSQAFEVSSEASREQDAQPVHAEHGTLQSALRHLPQRPRVQPRSARASGRDRIPDQAA